MKPVHFLEWSSQLISTAAQGGSSSPVGISSELSPISPDDDKLRYQTIDDHHLSPAVG